jgi:ribose transport system substrate-binding protein
MVEDFAEAPSSSQAQPMTIEFDGGKNSLFDPDNGYRDQYKKIWGK